MNNTTIINIFKSVNNNIAYVKTQNCQIITTITNRTWKFKPMIKKTIVADDTIFTVITLTTSIPLLKSTLS